MQPLHLQLEDDVLKNDTTYFLSFLTDRFLAVNQRWAAILRRRFGGTFEPIFILSNEHGGRYKERSYIVLNHSLVRLREELARMDVVDMIYPEDLSSLAVQSPPVRDLAAGLVAKQGTLFVLAFSSLNLDFKLSGVVLLGPDPQVVEKYDNKTEQIRFFKRLGMLRHRADFYEGLEDLQRRHDAYPCYITASYSSGGFESVVARSKEDIDAYGARIRPLNLQKEFVVSEYIDYEQAPNVSALVCGAGDVRIICISDQLLKGTVYMGNIYPSLVPAGLQQEIISLTRQAGDALAREGFRGLFGMDFLIDGRKNIYPIDLNPRRQGGYLCNMLMGKAADLAEAELRLALGEAPARFGTGDFECGFAWAHRKLAGRNKTIEEEVNEGSIEAVFSQPGSSYMATFYPKGSLVVSGSPATYAVSAATREEVVARLERDAAAFSRRLFGESA